MFDDMDPADQAFVLIVALIVAAVVIVKVANAVAQVRTARHQARGRAGGEVERWARDETGAWRAEP